MAIYGPFEHLGGSRGSFGCFRGSAPTKYAIIFQGLVKALEWIVLFLRFWVKMGPSGPKKDRFGLKLGVFSGVLWGGVCFLEFFDSGTQNAFLVALNWLKLTQI